METLPEKQHAHDLIERLPAAEIATVVRFLEFMLLDPVARALALAPADDEPLTDSDRRRLRDGHAWLNEREGKGIPMNDVLAEFGVTSEDLRHLSENAQ